MIQNDRILFHICYDVECSGSVGRELDWGSKGC